MFNFEKEIKEYMINNNISFDTSTINKFKGFYIASTDKIFINLSSLSWINHDDYSLIINDISKSILHEYLHKLINKITTKVRNNDYEENLVQYLSNQKEHISFRDEHSFAKTITL